LVQKNTTKPISIQRFSIKTNLSDADRSISKLHDRITPARAKLNDPSDKDAIAVETSRIHPFDRSGVKKWVQWIKFHAFPAIPPRQNILRHDPNKIPLRQPQGR
jgi:hypothetical protein